MGERSRFDSLLFVRRRDARIDRPGGLGGGGIMSEPRWAAA